MIFRKVNRTGVVKCMKLFVVEMCYQVVSHIHILVANCTDTYGFLCFFPLPVSVCAWRGGDVTCLSVCDMSTSTLPPFILACTLCGVNVSARCVYRQSTHIHTCSFYGRSTFAL